MNESTKFYLPQLDGLRFFAFFLVFLHHIGSAANFIHPKHTIAHWIATVLSSFGWIGVDIFLCLSSFLLTVLLMKEYQATGNISIKNFFVRRALRIWPLYYFFILLVFLIFPLLKWATPGLHSSEYHVFFHQQFLPFSLFLGNFSYAYFTSSLYLPIRPLWTVSLEEQFYLIWPILLYILLPRNKKWFLIVLAGMVILSFLVRFYIIQNSINYPAIWVFTLGRLDPFALGAFLAFIHLNLKSRLQPLIAILLAFFLFKLVVGAVFGGPATIWQLFAVDVASCLLIYASLHSKRLAKLLSFGPLPWLGKISFGLYMYHLVILAFTLFTIMPHISKKVTLFVWFIMLVIGLTLTILVSFISYCGLEKPFLKLKNRFTIIASRPA